MFEFRFNFCRLVMPADVQMNFQFAKVIIFIRKKKDGTDIDKDCIPVR